MSDSISSLTISHDSNRKIGGLAKIEHRGGATAAYITGVGAGLVTGTSRPISSDLSGLGTLKNKRVAYSALTAATGDAGALSWQNTTGSTIHIDRVVVVVTDAADNASTLDVGVASTAASAENLIDDLDVNAAAGVFDNLKNGGTAGKSGAQCANDYYVTATITDATGFAGYVLIYYTVI